MVSLFCSAHLTFEQLISFVQFDRGQYSGIVGYDSSDRSKDKSDQKVILFGSFNFYSTRLPVWLNLLELRS